jgi:hypothetical protein
MYFLLGLIAFLILPPQVCAHSHHPKEDSRPAATTRLRQDQIEKINNYYMKTIKPIFQRKCFDCHSSQTLYPWYHRLPGIKNWLDQDVSEGRKHLEMTKDFPFGGHGNPIDDLQAIRETTLKNSMPPTPYRFMHPSSQLSEEEKEEILKWIEVAETLLQQKK